MLGPSFSRGLDQRSALFPSHRNFWLHSLFADGDRQDAKPVPQGFRTTTLRLLQAGQLSAYVRSGPDLRATYLDVAPKDRSTLRQQVQARTACRGNSPLCGAGYENWPRSDTRGLSVHHTQARSSEGLMCKCFRS